MLLYIYTSVLVLIYNLYKKKCLFQLRVSSQKAPKITSYMFFRRMYRRFQRTDQPGLDVTMN